MLSARPHKEGHLKRHQTINILIWREMNNNLQLVLTAVRYSWQHSRIVNFSRALISSRSSRHDGVFVWKQFLRRSKSSFWAVRDNDNHSSHLVYFNDARKLVNLLGNHKRSNQRTQIFIQLLSLESGHRWPHHRFSNGAVFCRISYQRGQSLRGHESYSDCSYRLFHIVHCFNA